MKKAIQFGAGNIGRGFIGAVLEQAGYHVVFADVNEQVVARINSDRAYTVQIMDTVCEQMRITDISAMDSRSPELAAQIAGAELVTTAVGLTVLPRIAGAIAAGIAARRDAGVTEPLNVIACENGVRATTQLREAVLKHLDEAQRDWCEQYVGFPDCSVDRIVPPVKSENPIDVVVERFFEWNVERAAFKGAVPEIPGMNPADNLIAYIERKLFTLNTGHAITAYLGRMKGYMTICQSISDEHIHTIVKAAMRESGRGLVALYGFDRDEITVRVVPGPQQDMFTDKGLATFYGQAYTTTTKCDRIGVPPGRTGNRDEARVRHHLRRRGVRRRAGTVARTAHHHAGRPANYRRLRENRHHRQRGHPEAGATSAGRQDPLRVHRRAGGPSAAARRGAPVRNAGVESEAAQRRRHIAPAHGAAPDPHPGGTGTQVAGRHVVDRPSRSLPARRQPQRPGNRPPKKQPPDATDTTERATT